MDTDPVKNRTFTGKVRQSPTGLSARNDRARLRPTVLRIASSGYAT
jgi:hypothetical protein